MKHLLMSAFMLLAGATAAIAQDDSAAPHSFWYGEVQGGVQLTTTTDASLGKLITPTAALSVGHYFTPGIGLRLHVNGPQAKSGYKSPDRYYTWNYLTGDVDLLLNLSNLLSEQQWHPLNVIFLAGVGAATGWNNDDYNKYVSQKAITDDFGWDASRTFHNIRAGLRLETDQRKKLGLSLEVDANHLEDRWNSKSSAGYDFQFTAMLGLALRFGQKASAPKFVKKVIEVVDTVETEEPATVMVTEKKPVTREEHKRINEVIFFQLRATDADDAMGTDEAIRKVAELMKTSDDAHFTVTGYADQSTGTAKLNYRYAMQRAQSVTNTLVNDHGIDAGRITTESMGDTVQPFPEDNDKNRCVIVTGEGTFRVTAYEDVQVEKQTTKKVKKFVTRQVEVEERVK